MTDAAALAVHLDPDALAAQMAIEVRAGLSGCGEEPAAEVLLRLPRQRSLRPDHPAAGVLPHPHRADDPQQRVDEIAAATGARTLIELGSGTSEKTRLLLARPDPRRHPANVSCPSTSTRPCSGRRVSRSRGSSPVCWWRRWSGTSRSHLTELPRSPQRLLVFLGSTIGNLDSVSALVVPGRYSRDARREGDLFLLGTDLVKSRERLVAAYDDAQGVTAEFNKNVLAVLNRSLGADFDLSAFDHVALWNDAEDRIEMRLRSRTDQVVRLAGLDLDVTFSGRRGDPDRDLVEVPPRGGVRRARRRGAGADALVDRRGRGLRALVVAADQLSQCFLASFLSLRTRCRSCRIRTVPAATVRKSPPAAAARSTTDSGAVTLPVEEGDADLLGVLGDEDDQQHQHQPQHDDAGPDATGARSAQGVLGLGGP